MDYNDYRISKLRMYLLGVIDTLTQTSNSQINADMLDDNINNYSLDKMPMASVVERWVTGDEIHKDVYSFRSRKAYSQDTLNNLKNIGFFEKFEDIVRTNNEQGILPDIDGIESIECLNSATLNNTDTKTAEFDIQIQITYRRKVNEQSNA